MALTPMTEGEKNRILRNFGLVFKNNDISLLDKYGYGFIYLASGFIAHYGLQGFIHHYGTASELGEDILSNQPSNQSGNFHKGEKNYEYMMQKKEIYNQICEFANGNFKNIPSDDECFKPPMIKEMFEEEPEWRKSIEEAYRKHLEYGNYFNATDPQRVVDLADITMAYNAKVVNGIGENHLTDNDFLNLEITTEKGQTGTPADMLNCYRDSIWEIFNHYSGRAFELGLEDPLEEEFEEEEGE